MLNHDSIKALSREVVRFGLTMLVVTQVISYLRSPRLDDPHIPEIDVTLIDGERFTRARLVRSVTALQRPPQRPAQRPLKRPLVIYFWGTWCSVCAWQSPVIQTLSAEADILSVAIGSGDDQSLSRFMAQEGYSFPVFNDQRGAWRDQLKVSSFPTIFIYDVKGELCSTEVGYTTLFGLRARLAWCS